MAMRFSDTSYLTISQVFTTFRPVSFCYWINTTAFNTVTDTGGHQTNRHMGVDDVWEARITTDYGTFTVWQFVNELYASATTTPPPAATTLPQVGVWFHVVVTSDANKVGTIYINGVPPEGTIPCSDTPTASTLCIGNRLDGVNNCCANGVMDDVRIYNRVLSDNEIETIYNCCGSDKITDGLVFRDVYMGVDGSPLGDVYSTPAVLNPKNTTRITTAANITLTSYTVPAGSNLVFVVAACAEGTNTGRVQATGITFNGVAMTSRATNRTTVSPYNGVVVFSLPVTAGASGNIVATWSGNNTYASVYAVTLVNVDGTIDGSTTALNNTLSATASLTTASTNTIIISACANDDGRTLTAVGTGHTVDSTAIASGCSGGIGHVDTTTPGTVSGIGFTSSPAPTGQVMALVGFHPVVTTQSITEISDNKYTALPTNNPVYTETFLKYRGS